MTEAEWLSSTAPFRMVDFVSREANRRKVSLFVCACCWRMSDPRVDHYKLRVLPLVEDKADGKESTAEYDRLVTEIDRLRTDLVCAVAPIRREYADGEPSLEEKPLDPLTLATYGMVEPLYWCINFQHLTPGLWSGVLPEIGHHVVSLNHADKPGLRQELRQEDQLQAQILRDIFGSPFRSTEVAPAWLTWDGGAVVKVAQAMYDTRTFEDMPILGDALQEAGCTHPDILEHCRKPGPHVKGCWLLDLLLTKS